ncbi:MAG: hypothetical protein ABSB15_12340, partial [Bryobacteraceae bacterium]
MRLALLAFPAAFLLLAGLGVLLFGRGKTPRRLSRVAFPPAEAELLRNSGTGRVSRIEKFIAPF